MKLSSTIVSAAVALMLGTTAAKNVAELNFSPDQVQNAILEIEQEEFRLGKREAKNVVNLNLIIDENLKKREAEGSPKNVYAAQLIIDDSELVKRDAKNVFTANLIIDDASLQRRDSKNVFNINMVFDEADLLQKREADAKNVVNIHLVIDDDSLLQKRGVENVVDLSISVDKLTSQFTDLLENPLNLGYLIGDEEYTPESVESTDENNVEVKLKKDSSGCHMMKKKLDLKSLAPVVSTFKDKSIDPVIEAKDKFALPDTFPPVDTPVKDTSLDPLRGDISSALVSREDLNLFAKYVRDTPNLYQSFEISSTEKPEKQILILAPNNDAVQSMERKPWQFPADITQAKSEDDEDFLIQRNIMNFVESHIVETEAFDAVSSSKAVEFKTLNGKTILLRNFGDSFKAKLADSEEWSDVIDTELLRNGAILTLGKTLIH